MAHKKITGIYRITNLRTGKHYVGSAESIRARWVQHRAQLRNGEHHSIKLQRSWDRHGQDAFEFAIVEELPDRSGIIAREQYWMDVLHGYAAGYNSCATAGSTIGHRRTDEQKAAAAAARALRPPREPSPEWRAAQAERARGVVFTEERRAKISEKAKARWVNDGGAMLAAIRASNKGRAWTPEQREKIMASRRPWTPEQRAAAAERMRNRKHSPESKAKIAASNARRVVSEATREKHRQRALAQHAARVDG